MIAVATPDWWALTYIVIGAALGYGSSYLSDLRKTKREDELRHELDVKADKRRFDEELMGACVAFSTAMDIYRADVLKLMTEPQAGPVPSSSDIQSTITRLDYCAPPDIAVAAYELQIGLINAVNNIVYDPNMSVPDFVSEVLRSWDTAATTYRNAVRTHFGVGTFERNRSRPVPSWITGLAE